MDWHVILFFYLVCTVLFQVMLWLCLATVFLFLPSCVCLGRLGSSGVLWLPVCALCGRVRLDLVACFVMSSE